MNLHTKLKDAGDRMGENNDCAVRAVAVVADVSYEKAHAALAAAGRKPRRRTRDSITRCALRGLGHQAVVVTDQYKGRTIRTLERELPVGKRFLIRTRGHILAARWGEVHDWSKGRMLRVIDIYQIVKR